MVACFFWGRGRRDAVISRGALAGDDVFSSFFTSCCPARDAIFVPPPSLVSVFGGGVTLAEDMLPGDHKRGGGDGDNVEPGSSGGGIPWQAQEREEGPKAWAILLFAFIGATATTYAVTQLRRSVDFFWAQLKSQPFSSWKNATNNSSYGSFREEAWKRYNRRLQEEYEEEMERVERIRRMQSVFNRERNKYKRSYESWRENDSGGYHQHFQRDDWYWKTDPAYKDYQSDQRTKSNDSPKYSGMYTMSHHYSVLGLDRSRETPYTDAEIKTAFRAKALEYHPDQNQNNKEAAEAKFKEVLTSYEAIKLERKPAKF